MPDEPPILDYRPRPPARLGVILSAARRQWANLVRSGHIFDSVTRGIFIAFALAWVGFQITFFALVLFGR